MMKDQISALIDGELPVESADHLFIALKAKNETSESWATYHLIGDVMRGNAVFKADFNERFMQRLDQEPSVLSPSNHAPANKGFTKTSTAWSLAASVAAVMFVGWVVLQQQVHNHVDVAPAEIAQNVASEYLLAHQSMAPSSTAYYIQPASYSESGN
ncbi:sigma-E factor negative regulatory protein [Methyloradius palustris]|nr:sigma-E factor negative regulatory protein [Methyloradius palustris]